MSEAQRFGWYEDVSREHGFEPLRVEGDLPRELAGTLYRTGPGLFGSFGRRYDHLFEGDGAISAVRFGGGSAQGAHRVVMSAGLTAERAAGRPLYGSAAPRLRRIANALRGRVKNVANTNVLAWQGRLFGLVESSRPTELAPDTLATIGETDLGGAVLETFTAHPHFTAARGATYGFGVRFGRAPALVLYELPAAGPARRIGEVALAANTVVHDFVATDRHLAFAIGPARLRALPVLLGEASADRFFAWEPERGTEIIAVPIDAPDRIIRFRTDAFFVWHFANAFERDGAIVADFVRHPDLRAVSTMRDEAVRGGAIVDMDGGDLCRAEIDLRRGAMRTESLWGEPCEFPTVDVRGAGCARRYAWLATTEKRPRSIARFDFERGVAAIWTPPPGQHVSEPIFAPCRAGSGECDGWVLVLVYDERAHASRVAVLDAARPEEGPLAQAHFDHHVPLTLHGTWVAA
ncbi:MAG TPA: carotenoid oxygenase family protein [Myxococcota bacterium]|nr:carotenoid oxygenase family protein [Myxococcota bacterium]